MKKEQEKCYYAFISHSRDYKICEWLHNRLENYVIPESIRNKYHTPKQLRKIYFDKNGEQGLELSSLYQYLDKSDFLIVVCSENSKNSQAVRDEVKHFKNHHKDDYKDRIICFFIEDNEKYDECMPEFLRDLKEEKEYQNENEGKFQGESWAIKLKEGSKKIALLRVISKMYLNGDVRELWDKERRRQRIRNWIYGVISTIIILLGILTWIYLRPTYRYFADYVDKWGVPTGIIELTKEQQKHRHRMYQFEYHRVPIGEPGFFCKKRVTAVRYVNSAHVTQEMSPEVQRNKGTYPVIHIEYNQENGDAYRWIFCDHKGKVILRHTLSERDGKKACIADFIAPKEQKGIGFVKAYNNSRVRFFTNPFANIVRYVYRRDSNGYITQKTYHCNNDYNLSRSATHDAGGIYGCSYSIDSLGRYTQMLYIDSNGNLTSSWEEVAGTRYKYDDYGNISIVEDIDKIGRAIKGQNDKWTSKVNFSDENGNVATTFWYDSKKWYRKTTYLYDSYGNMIEEANWGPDGELTDGEWYSKKTLKYDKQGNVIEQAFWNSNREPSEWAGPGLNYSKITYKYDKQRNVIEEVQYNQEGVPSFSPYSNAVKIIYQYDDNNKIKETYLDVKGQPCMYNGYACITYKYDYLGNEIERAYLDSNYQPCVFCHYSKITRKFDDLGNCTEEAFWDTNNRPSLDGMGWYAKLTLKYDDYGKLAESATWGIDGKPCAIGGTCRNSFTYDDKGNLIEIIHYDIDGHYTKDIIKYEEKEEIIKK